MPARRQAVSGKGVDRRTRRSIREAPFWQAYGRRRYAVLFYCLLIMLIVLPAANTLGLPQFAIKLLVAACLLAAVMPNASKGHRWAFLAAVLLLIGLRFVAEPDEVPISFGPVLALYGLTGLLATVGTLKFVVKSPNVDGETVYAALSTYLLAGLFFLKFWRRSRDTLFAIFAAAFWLLALNQVLLAIFSIPREERGWVFLLRLAAFALIVAAIVHKNIAGRRPQY